MFQGRISTIASSQHGLCNTLLQLSPARITLCKTGKQEQKLARAALAAEGAPDSLAADMGSGTYTRYLVRLQRQHETLENMIWSVLGNP